MLLARWLVRRHGLLPLPLLLFEFFEHVLIMQNRVREFILENAVVQELRDPGFDAWHLEDLVDRRPT